MKTSLGEATRYYIRETLRGPWTASLRVESLPPIVVGAQIVIDGTWNGVVTSAYQVAEEWELEVIAGQGRLAELTEAKQYVGGGVAGAIAADLCVSVGEFAAGDESEVKGTWRSRGGALAVELTRLSKDWYIGADGKVHLLRTAPPTPLIGDRVQSRGECFVCQVDGAPPVVGATVEGIEVETAVLRGGDGVNPRVTLWPRTPDRQRDPAIIAGTMTALTGGRAAIDLDNGETLTEVPLFCAAGFVPEGASEVRVLVLDIGDDGANTIAITGVDGRIDALILANATEAGTLLRSGDKIGITGLTIPGPIPVSATPGATIISLDPTVSQIPGPPGAGSSRVKG